LQKKKQKNSYLRRGVAKAGQRPAVNRRFLVLFFKKEPLSSMSTPLSRCGKNRFTDKGRAFNLFPPVMGMADR
jgi:hypothetical protein